MAVSPEDQQTRIESLDKWKIRIKSYKLGDQYVCTVDNLDPGAVIARAQGATRREAESKAVETAKSAMKV